MDYPPTMFSAVLADVASIGTFVLTAVALWYARRQLYSWKQERVAEAKAEHGQRVLLAARKLTMLLGTTRRVRGRGTDDLGGLVETRSILVAKSETLFAGAQVLEDFREAAFLAEVFWPTKLKPLADQLEKTYTELSLCLSRLKQLEGEYPDEAELKSLWDIADYSICEDEFEESVDSVFGELKVLISGDLSFE